MVLYPLARRWLANVQRVIGLKTFIEVSFDVFLTTPRSRHHKPVTREQRTIRQQATWLIVSTRILLQDQIDLRQIRWEISQPDANEQHFAYSKHGIDEVQAYIAHTNAENGYWCVCKLGAIEQSKDLSGEASRAIEGELGASWLIELRFYVPLGKNRSFLQRRSFQPICWRSTEETKPTAQQKQTTREQNTENSLSTQHWDTIIPQPSHQTKDIYTSSTLFIPPATTETHNQDTFCRTRFSLHCTYRLELSEQLHCR